MIDLTRNYFDLFGLPERFRVDPAALDRAYRELQSEVHPDRHASGTEAQKRVALQSSARVNEGYRSLKDPVERASYLLELRGIDAAGEGDTQLPLEFLERQLERREEASEANAASDSRRLDSIVSEVDNEARDLEDSIAILLDRDHAYAEARGRVRELRFLKKVSDDLRALQHALDEH
jgi:molecular chaperone HscB